MNRTHIAPRHALVALVGVILATLPLAPAAAAPIVTCAERSSSSQCDADTDRIVDVVEQQVCGTATCATGREDRDRDGIPDWSELVACGTARCADPGKDGDLDGIPDFAELYVCGTSSCSGGREDIDGDRIGDWVEFVICGDSTCANGGEDYDNDGISDAKQLTACIVAFDVTGSAFVFAPPFSVDIDGDGVLRVEIVNWWPLIIGAALALLGLAALGVALLLQRRRDRQREASDQVADSVDVIETMLR
jgi:hypothetical protein